MRSTLFTLSLIALLAAPLYGQEEQKSYYDNGAVREVLTTQGNESKLVTYYPDGQVYSEQRLKNNQPHGRMTRYYQNGKKESVVDFVNGRAEGMVTNYYDSGNIRVTQPHVNGNPHGECIEYFPDGQIAVKGNYDDGRKIGKWESYYSNQTLRSILEFDASGVAIGSVIYYENGQKREEGALMLDNQHGQWTYYFNNGQMSAQIIWNQGKMVKSVSAFDGAGNPMDPGTLDKGNGTVIFYGPEGDVTQTLNVVEGIAQYEE